MLFTHCICCCRPPLAAAAPVHRRHSRPLPPARTADEQRAQVKGIKVRSLINKAKNEAARELEEAQSDAPIHFLRVDGRALHLGRNDAAAYAQQQAEGLVPWAAQPGVLIDRYDVRSLLDMYVPPDPR